MMKGRQASKGIKRKRNDSFKEKDLNAKLVGKLHHDLREVRKAAKRAKTFEMQKLVKKLKGLRLKNTSEQDITEYESQLEQLKEISHEAVANTALKSKLSKDKELSNNQPIQAALTQELNANFLSPAQGATPAAKVQSRLLSSKILAAEVASALEDLRLVLHPSDALSADGGEEEGDALDSRPRKMKKLMGQNDDEGDVPMEVVDADPPDLGDMEDEADEVNSEYESGTIGDDEKEPDDDWEFHSLATDDNGEHMEEDLSESERVSSSKRAGSSSTSRPKVSTIESTFLPSLSTGFIRGDSSDLSDGEERAADPAVKKNRRGQRARRAIWEKKYGSNANHKKKEATESNERGRNRWSQNANSGGRGPDVKTTRFTGSKYPNRNQRGTGLAHPPEFNSGSATQAHAKPDQKALHPSWEAKRRLKEKMSVAIAPPPPGRKIKFS
ncbi:hypothetical protein V5O48_003374 [Marasmius crinis-equi]|uniref:Bud22 domain-containing protein n=1 Tax=Marasmius crinis-equi TaxID=585013 RepID=A0ABR3FT23_9AGAR